MNRIVCFLTTFLTCFVQCIAQTINNPVFDRCDVPDFRIKEVKVTSDTTYVYCLYYAEEDSWANISKDMYLEDITCGKRLTVTKSLGLPFGPEKRIFTHNDTIQVLLLFPHIETNIFNLIEEENSRSFNIYGVNLNQTFTNSYTPEDISIFFRLAQKEEYMENWQSAINYSLKQLHAAEYVEGLRSFPSACAMYNLTMQLIIGTKEYNKAIEWGEKAIEIINSLPKDSTRLDVLARTYGNVGTAHHLMGEHEKGNQYKELSLAIRRFKDGVGVYNYEQYLRHMSLEYYYEGNYPKALLYGREVADIYEKKYKFDPNFACVYANSLSNLCEFYHQMSKFKEAVECGKRALELFKRESCEESTILKCSIYHNLALVLKSAGHNDEALKLIELALADSDLVKPNLFQDYINLKISHAGIQNDTVKAIREYESILKTLEDSTSLSEKKEYHLEYKRVFFNLYSITEVSHPLTGDKYIAN